MSLVLSAGSSFSVLQLVPHASLAMTAYVVVVCVCVFLCVFFFWGGGRGGVVGGGGLNKG